MRDPRIAELAKQQIYLGTSSWKYPGWKGLIYRDAYKTDKAFNENCLAEYAQNYPCVGVDHTYYTWPTPAAFAKYKALTPPTFRFGLKVTERITVFRYPNIKRYGKEAGKTNESFLSAGEFREQFLAPLADVRDRLGPLMLEFSQFHPGTIGSGREFVERLDRFFSELDESGDLRRYQLAVEIRNRNWLKEPYFALLQKHGVAHVFNSWTRMPSLGEQLEMAKGYELPCLVSRVLLQPGTKYEQAVEAFSPYDKMQDAQPELRASAADLIRRAIQQTRAAYVFVNNRAEGCAPITIQGVLDLL